MKNNIFLYFAKFVGFQILYQYIFIYILYIIKLHLQANLLSFMGYFFLFPYNDWSRNQCRSRSVFWSRIWLQIRHLSNRYTFIITSRAIDPFFIFKEIFLRIFWPITFLNQPVAESLSRSQKIFEGLEPPKIKQLRNSAVETSRGGGRNPSTHWKWSKINLPEG